jgi:hypothetical protein
LCHTITEGGDNIDELKFLKRWCNFNNYVFNPFFSGSKYACYKIKTSGCSVIRVDDMYYIFSKEQALMFNRVLKLYRTRKEILSDENLLCL